MSTTFATLPKAISGGRRVKGGRLPPALHEHFPDVKSVVDATEHVAVHVTRGDCANAKSGKPAECAMARAFQRQHHADGAIIGMGSSYLIVGDKAVRFKTPQSVAREIVSFDRKAGFLPGAYSLYPVPTTARLGNRPGRARGVADGSRNSRRVVHRRSLGVRVLAGK